MGNPIKSDSTTASAYGSTISNNASSLLGSSITVPIQTTTGVTGNIEVLKMQAMISMKNLSSALRADAKNVKQLGLDYQTFDENMQVENMFSDYAK